MQFLEYIVFITALAGQTLAGTTKVKLRADSKHSEIDGNPMYYMHEGATSNYFFVEYPEAFQVNAASNSDAGPELTYDDETKIIYTEVNEHLTLNFSSNGGIVQLSGVAPVPVEIDPASGELKFEGSDQIFAAKNINDPFGFSKDRYAVVVGDRFGGLPMVIVANFV
ncbi:uncharacterized protein LODBEIA_P58420 [Lodderomyces beijingensis]|uniref:Uncharacterized protein n=1 Tax=Lodderomyces beijingensis TaxID=1775926 RepID=A0ABP0ZTZ8_9ASCO